MLYSIFQYSKASNKQQYVLSQFQLRRDVCSGIQRVVTLSYALQYYLRFTFPSALEIAAVMMMRTVMNIMLINDYDEITRCPKKHNNFSTLVPFRYLRHVPKLFKRVQKEPNNQPKFFRSFGTLLGPSRPLWSISNKN